MSSDFTDTFAGKKSIEFQRKLAEVIDLTTSQIGDIIKQEVTTIDDLAMLDKMAMEDLLKRLGDQITVMKKLQIRAFASWYNDVKVSKWGEEKAKEPSLADFNKNVCLAQIHKMKTAEKKK
jgi:hypothetical protein